MKFKLLFILLFTILLQHTYANNIGDAYAQGGVAYEITSLSPFEVKATGRISGLLSISIPEIVSINGTNFSVVEIEDEAFKNLGLTGITLPRTLRVIGFQALSFNTFTSITIPESVTHIGDQAFRKNLLTDISIPSSVTYIGTNAFMQNNISTISFITLTPPDLLSNVFDNKSSINLKIATGTTSAFTNADWTGFGNISEIGIGDTLIKDGVTYEITVVGTPNEVKTLDYDFSFGSTLNIPETLIFSESYTVTEIGEASFGASIGESLTNISLPLTIKTIGASAFSNNNNLNEIILPEGIISIADGTFFNCRLYNVTLPNSLLTIGDNAFNTNTLSNISIPEGVTSIGNSAFRDNDLTSVNLPSTLTTLGFNVFWNNLNLTQVSYQSLGNPAMLEPFVFNDESKIHLTIPSSATFPSGATATYAARGWTGFASVTEYAALVVGSVFIMDDIEYEVTALGTTNTLKTIDYYGRSTYPIIPNTVTYFGTDYDVTVLGSESFKNNALVEISIPNTITEIENQAIAFNNIASITIPSSVITLAEGAFRNNLLTNVTIPSAVTTLNADVFKNNAITEVTYQTLAPATLSSGVFDDNSLIDLTIDGVAANAYTTAGWTGFKSINTVLAKYTLATNTTNGTINADIIPTNGTYDDGTIVELTATPDTGYQFDGWSGDATGTTNPLNITIDADKNVTAMFSTIQQTFTTTNTNGTVTVDVSPTNGTYDYGTVVTLTATPDAGYQFDSWSGDATGTTNPLSITMDADKSITPMFSLIQKVLTTTATNGTVTVDVAPTNGSYTRGTVVELTATPDTGYQFDGWSGDATGTTNPLSITMDADKSITAAFILIPCNINIPDANFKAALVADTTINTDGDTEISCDEAIAFTGVIDVQNIGITDATGIEAFVNTTTIFLNNNSITSLDLSKNLAVTVLDLSSNLITSLDLSKNLAITKLTLTNNSITSLDLSKNVLLERIRLSNNDLSSLNVAIGSRSNNIFWYGFNIEGNPNLTCVTVSNLAWANQNWIEKDAQVSYSLNCNASIQQTLTTTNTNGTVTVDVAPINGTYDFGTEVTLTATPDAGYQFDGWSGDATGTTNPLTIIMDADKNITAMFSVDDNLSVRNSTIDGLKISVENQTIKTNLPNITIVVYNLLGEQVINKNLDGIYLIHFKDNKGNHQTTKMFITE